MNIKNLFKIAAILASAALQAPPATASNGFTCASAIVTRPDGGWKCSYDEVEMLHERRRLGRLDHLVRRDYIARYLEPLITDAPLAFTTERLFQWSGPDDKAACIDDGALLVEKFDDWNDTFLVTYLHPDLGQASWHAASADTPWKADPTRRIDFLPIDEMAINQIGIVLRNHCAEPQQKNQFTGYNVNLVTPLAGYEALGARLRAGPPGNQMEPTRTEFKSIFAWRNCSKPTMPTPNTVAHKGWVTPRCE